MKIIEYDESYYLVWQDFVIKYGNLYHDIRWKYIIEDTYKLRSKYLLFFLDENLVAIYPSFFIKKDILMSLPYISFCGIAVAPNIEIDSVNLLLFINLKNNGISSLINRNLDLHKHVFSNSDYVTMILKLETDHECQFSKFHYKQKNMIRSAYKNKFSLIQSNTEEYYPIYLKATNALGTPGHKKVFFENIVSYFADSVRINTLNLDSKTIGAIFEIDFKETRYDLWAFSYKNFKQFKPNVFLYWETLKNSIDSKIAFYDFGRSVYDGNTYKFKKKWNAIPEKLNYYKVNLSNENNIDIIKPLSAGLLPKIWMKMPNLFCNKFGPVIRKFIY